MRTTTFDEFVSLSRRGTFVPVVREVPADLLTPVSAFLRIAERSEHAFLFESVEGGERVARYSFLGKDPFLILRATRDGRAILEEGGVRSMSEKGPIETLRDLMGRYRAPF
ncbi:MAG: anthranilate synthase component I, partial [Phycisphaerales bacterium]